MFFTKRDRAALHVIARNHKIIHAMARGILNMALDVSKLKASSDKARDNTTKLIALVEQLLATGDTTAAQAQLDQITTDLDASNVASDAELAKATAPVAPAA